MAVWENRSFSRAAQEIYLTQPTVSGHIRTLEDALGVQLFDRGGKKVVPTKAGEFFYPFVRQILKLISQSEREMAMFLGQEKGSLELGGSNIPGQYILPALIGRFRAKRPNAQVILRIADTTAITVEVANSDLELGMVGAVVPKTGLRFEPCFHEDMVLIVAPDHHFAHSKQVSLILYLSPLL
ncbi:MAG: LysR family transcriptional regulator [Nitrospiraceae bacterium]|nr:LysR family transcriptional regulator [Nitrospiraceae bacterium]